MYKSLIKSPPSSEAPINNYELSHLSKLAKPKTLIQTAKEPTKAVSPKFHLPKRLVERRKGLEILEKERKKQEAENKKIKESEGKFPKQ